MVPVLKDITNRPFTRAVSPGTKAFFSVNDKNRYQRASLTTEAALCFPVFFFAVYLLWQLFLLVMFQMEVCHEITEAAMRYAHLGYPERQAEEEDVDISWLYQPLLWNALPSSEQAENMWVLCLADEDGSIEVKVGYRFVCEAVFFTGYAIPVQQNFRFYPYIGKTEELPPGEGTKEDVVYMTEYGTVYHESRACGYLNVVVYSADVQEIGGLRNSSGRKYTLCERCDDREPGTMVYYSAGGEKYHLAASCPGLKRTVTEKNREDVGNVPACHKCGGKTEKKEEENDG